MTGVHCFTSASFAYLDRVRVLGETLKRFHPSWRLSLCLSDREPEGFSLRLEDEPIDEIVRIEDLGIPNFRSWIFKHDVVELCTAVKGAMLLRLLDAGYAKVVYLDPDIALFGSLSEVEGLLDSYEILLTPHQLEPDEDLGAIADNEIGSLKWGIFNLGFLAVANRAEGKRFARWWWSRLYHFCVDDVPSGLFTDQRWCDHIPSFFPGAHILRDPGYNVASWNLSRRPIAIGLDGTIRAGGSPLRFFHFTKIGHAGAVQLERYASGRIEVFELMEWYQDRLRANVSVGLPKGWWTYDRYDDGTPVPRDHRVAYRTRRDLQEQIVDPFAAGADVLSNAIGG